jgi:hypothetical protein
MAWQASDLAAIEACIASGQLIVKYADTEVEYRSMTELLKAKSVIEQTLNQGNPLFTVRQYRFRPKSNF